MLRATLYFALGAAASLEAAGAAAEAAVEAAVDAAPLDAVELPEEQPASTTPIVRADSAAILVRVPFMGVFSFFLGTCRRSASGVLRGVALQLVARAAPDSTGDDRGENSQTEDNLTHGLG